VRIRVGKNAATDLHAVFKTDTHVSARQIRESDQVQRAGDLLIETTARSERDVRRPTPALAYAELGKLEDARHCISEAMTAAEITKEQWYLAEINRIAGEIALKAPDPDAAKAEGYFERALAVAGQQQAKTRSNHRAGCAYPGNSAPP
jgi:predicted ATPase